MRREFTGRHMFAALVAMFGVVIGVNLFMATLAVGGFSGVVVENTYVASQHFNGWLAKAREQETLGWRAKVERLADGRLAVATDAVPVGAQVSATLRRPLGERETTPVSFTEVRPGRFASEEKIAGGRWIARLIITADGHEWSHEAPLP